MKKNKHRVLDESSDRRAPALTVQSEKELERERFELNRLEYIVAPVVAVLAGVWAFRYIGTSIGWDDLFYMGASQHTTPQAWVMNRYAHIYMQKFFFWLTGNALTGAKLYWCFLFFSTAVLVYWCARMLAGKRGYMAGLVAVLLFCSQPIFVQCAGCTDVDLAVMFLFMLATFIYLTFLVGRYKYRHLIIMLLGFLFFWVMKSKETGICMAVLFFGLGEDRTAVRSIGRFAKDIGWVCVGMLVGSLLLMSLDQALMGDFWFSVRPVTIRRLFDYNIGEFAHDARNRSWYTLLSADHLLTAFLLYLLVGWKPPGKDKLSRHEIVVWLIPSAVLFFIIAITIKVTCGSPHRYIIPAIPGICIWAAQFFRFKPIDSGREKSGSKTAGSLPEVLINWAVVLAAFIMVSLLMYKIPDMVSGAGWKSLEKFYDCVILPLATTGLVIYAIAFRKRGPAALFFLSFCLFFIVYFPLSNNLTSLKQRAVAKRSEYRYMPYRVFADELRFDKDVKILVSKDVHKRTWMLGRAKSSHYDMFNIFFNQEFDYNQFIDGSWEDILKGDYTYAFLTWQDWDGIRKKHNIEHLIKNYTVKGNKKVKLILLKKH